MQLGIVLTSLQDNQHVATVLGLTASTGAASDVCTVTDFGDTQMKPESSCTQNLQLAELLMKTILRNLAAHTVSEEVWELVVLVVVVMVVVVVM